MKQFTVNQILIVLGEISLDPLDRSGWIYKEFKPGKTTFCFHFDRICFPGSPIYEESSDSEMCRKLMAAVKENLDGPMFLAAKQHRDLENQWQKGSTKRNEINYEYWLDLKNKGVIPDYFYRLPDDWFDTPIGSLLLEKSPREIAYKEYQAKLDDLRKQAWPGFYKRCNGFYYDYVKAIRSINP